MGLKNNINVGVSGHFKIEKTGADGEVLETYGFDNLVLDSGLSAFFVSNIADSLTHCAVGKGNSAPAFAQKQLDDEIARQRTNNSYGAGRPVESDADYAFLWSYSFAPSAVSGNITEIGILSNRGIFFNRQLIKDGEGNPTSISVLEQEGLNVYFTLKVYMGNPNPQEVLLNDILYTVFYSFESKCVEFITTIDGCRCGSLKGTIHNKKNSGDTFSFQAKLPSGAGRNCTISSTSKFYVFDAMPSEYRVLSFYLEPELTKDQYHELTFDIKIKVGRYGE